MQITKEFPRMWLYDSVEEKDLKINKALHKAKRSIMQYNKPRSAELLDQVKINAAGQTAIAADILSETIFLNTLIDEGISGTMYSEESGVKTFGEPSEGDDTSIVCILDPLDGSANYMKGIPFGCISIAYGEYQEEPRLGDLTSSMLMSLYTDEEFFADLGYGAYKNGNSLKTFEELSLKSFEQRSIQMSYYAYGSKASKYYFDFQEKYSLRSLGSAAWEMGLVAENRNDAFVDLRGVLKTHDFAGAKLIIEELGGKVEFLNQTRSDVQNIPLDDFQSGYSVIATLDEELLKFMKKEFQDHGMISLIQE